MTPFVLGVTGAIGAGKSAVCGILLRRGWAVLDLDDVAEAAVVAALPEVALLIPAVRAADGSVNKAAIFSAMLHDPLLRQDLETLLRPYVFQHVQDWIGKLRAPGVLDAALLFESGLDTLCRATICVACPRTERQRRVLQRPTASAQHFAALEAAQLSESEKCARASATLSTAGPEALLDAQIRYVLQQLDIDFGPEFSGDQKMGGSE